MLMINSLQMETSAAAVIPPDGPRSARANKASTCEKLVKASSRLIRDNKG